MSVGIAKNAMLATASASVATAKKRPRATDESDR